MDFVKNAVIGTVAAFGLVIILLGNAWTSFIEEDIPDNEVEIKSTSFEIDDLDYPILDVKVRMTNHSNLTLSDYVVSVVVYDCASEVTPLEYCFILATVEDDNGSEIKPGLTGEFVKSFSLSSMAKPHGVMKYNVTVSEFEGH